MENSKWCNLPRDILAMIAKRLRDDLMDIGRLRAVCSTWHSSLRHPLRNSPVSPLQVPCPYEPTSYIPAPNSHPFFLYRRTLMRLSPLDDNNKQDPWIIRVEETSPNKWLLLDPFPRPYVKCRFPNIRVDQMPSHINLLQYKIHEITRSYHPEGLIHRKIFDMVYEAIVQSIAQPDNTGTIEADDQNIIVLIMYGSSKLACWRSGDEVWTPVEKGDCKFKGITCHRGDFYAIGFEDGRLMRVDLDKYAVEMVVKPPPQFGYFLKFINFDNCLFLMTYGLPDSRSYNPNLKLFYRFRLHVLNEENGAWEIAKDLHNGVFFFKEVTDVLAVSAKDLGCPKGDFLYYSGFPYFIKEEDGSQSGTCSTLICDTDSSFATSLQSQWDGLLPFWPPPSWIMQPNKHEDEE